MGDMSEMGGGGEVFPRVKERDPYRRLGIDSEASYEEVQDARNYLVETYRWAAGGGDSLHALHTCAPASPFHHPHFTPHGYEAAAFTHLASRPLAADV